MEAELKSIYTSQATTAVPNQQSVIELEMAREPGSMIVSIDGNGTIRLLIKGLTGIGFLELRDARPAYTVCGLPDAIEQEIAKGRSVLIVTMNELIQLAYGTRASLF